jgi:hypothetical protein
MKVGILLAEDINWETFHLAIKDKYDLTKSEILDIKNNTVFNNRPMIVKGTNILFTDGGYINLKKVTLYMDNVFLFACGNKEIKENNKKNWHILQDDRVYEKPVLNGINYKKKILFSKFRKLNKSNNNNIMLYGTKNCRQIPVSLYNELLNKYQENFICLTNNTDNDIKNDRMKFLSLPVYNLFEKFNTYIYTPIDRKFDCSPRFIAECKYYNKSVIFYNIDYLDADKGLYWRKYDIEKDFESIFLTDADPIINIIENTIKVKNE